MAAPWLQRLVESVCTGGGVVCQPGLRRDGGYTDYLRLWDPSAGGPTPVYVNYTGKVDFALHPDDVDEVRALPGVRVRSDKSPHVSCRVRDEASLSSALALALDAIEKSRAG